MRHPSTPGSSHTQVNDVSETIRSMIGYPPELIMTLADTFSSRSTQFELQSTFSKGVMPSTRKLLKLTSTYVTSARPAKDIAHQSKSSHQSQNVSFQYQLSIKHNNKQTISGAIHHANGMHIVDKVAAAASQPLVTPTTHFHSPSSHCCCSSVQQPASCLHRRPV